jgi:Tfp pilus assembly protein PilF
MEEEQQTNSTVADSESAQPNSEQTPSEKSPDGINRLISKLMNSSSTEVQQEPCVSEKPLTQEPALAPEDLAELTNNGEQGRSAKFADGPFLETIRGRAIQRAQARAKPLSEYEAEEANRSKQEKIENARVTRTQIVALKKNDEPATVTKIAYSIRPIIFVGCLAVFLISAVATLLVPKAHKSVTESVEPTQNKQAQTNKAILDRPKKASLPPTISDVNAILKKASADYRANNKTTALNELDQAVRIAPADSSVYLARADYYFSEHKIAAAAEDYKRALDLNPHLAIAKKRLARCQPAESETTAEAKPTTGLSVSEGTDLKKLGFDALRSKGYDALQANRLNFAVAALSQCVKMKPNDAVTRRYLAFACVRTGDAALAISQFQAWDSLDKADLNYKLDFSKTLAASEENREQTTGVFNTLVRENSRDADSLITISQTCVDLGITDGPALRALRLASVVADSAQKEKILTVYESINSKSDEPSRAGGESSRAGGSQAKLPASFDLNEYRTRASKSAQ